MQNGLILLHLIGGLATILAWNEVDIVRVGSLVDPSEVVNYDLHVKKINRTTCAVSGTVQMLVTANDVKAYRCAVRAFYSSSGSNQFRLFPFKAERADIPKLFNGLYRNYVMDDLKPPVSDVPYSDDKTVDLTELILKPANYTVNGYTISLKKIPKTIPNGLYKILIEVSTESGELVAGFFVLASVY